MGDLATTMRDPVFYRWHAYIDFIFQRLKGSLPRYTVEQVIMLNLANFFRSLQIKSHYHSHASMLQLDYPGVTVTGVSVKSQGGTMNQFQTFWQQSDVDLSRGMDFQPRGAVLVRFTHLQHEPFAYTINVNNSSGQNRRGTCRVYLGPKFDERGNPWLYNDQKLTFIELDKFTVTCKLNKSKATNFKKLLVFDENCTCCSRFFKIMINFMRNLLFSVKQGKNTITRNSSESSVTIPFERTFRDLDVKRPANNTEELANFNFCGCGWPDHLLIPKGTAEGFPCQLFVMISNIDGDKVRRSFYINIFKTSQYFEFSFPNSLLPSLLTTRRSSSLNPTCV